MYIYRERESEREAAYVMGYMVYMGFSGI